MRVMIDEGKNQTISCGKSGLSVYDPLKVRETSPGILVLEDNMMEVTEAYDKVEEQSD